MNIDWIGSPNYTEGRKYYWTWDNFRAGRIGKVAEVDKIIYHWIDGHLTSADTEFQKPKRQASAHFGIEDGVVHQYVKRENTAWHAGSGKVNSESFGIEHAGSPSIAITDETYESSAQLVYFICKSQGKRVDDFQHEPHRKYANTQCPGTLDIARIVNRAKEIEAQNGGVGIDQPIGGVSVDAVQAMATPAKVYAPFNTDLEPSQTYNDEVKRVQEFLIDRGYLEIIPANNFGYYGMKTQTAIDKFQKANSIPRATKFGWWYPATRAKANQQLVINK